MFIEYLSESDIIGITSAFVEIAVQRVMVSDVSKKLETF
jgi:hypothetical protein